MKVAFTTSGSSLADPLDSRFGRAPRFLIYDLESESLQIIDNQQNLNAAQGAGIQSAQAVARSGARSLVTGHCGPKAFQVLKAAGVSVYNTDAATVADALQLFRDGKLTPAGGADVEAHWT